MRYLLGLVVVIVTLAALIWTGVNVTPTPRPSANTAAADGNVALSELPFDVASAPGSVTPSEQPATTPLAAGTTPALLVPVQGVKAADLTDTFTDARSEGRSHEAIDIMAPAGTPVVAVEDGYIEKLFTSERGGLTIYQFEAGGRFAYYYAHLQGYAPGLAEKQVVKRGQVIGYVGSTGNADPAAPHLHFSVFVLGPERRWWERDALNPYPMLTQP